jgi:hypothetical protein
VVYVSDGGLHLLHTKYRHCGRQPDKRVNEFLCFHFGLSLPLMKYQQADLGRPYAA